MSDSLTIRRTSWMPDDAQGRTARMMVEREAEALLRRAQQLTERVDVVDHLATFSVRNDFRHPPPGGGLEGPGDEFDASPLTSA